MCFVCGDADKKKAAIESTECTGELMPYLTLNQLKADLTQESLKTGKADFLIFQNIMIENTDKTFSFDIQHTCAPAQTVNVTFV